MRVGLISPFRNKNKAKRIMNVSNAQLWEAEQRINGNTAIVPHILFMDVLDDGIQEQRDLGMGMGRKLFKTCDVVEVHTWGSGQRSEGMWEDIKFCEENNIKLRHFD